MPEDRVARLMLYQSFAAIANLVADADIREFVWERFEGLALQGCHRASYLLKVNPTTYDAFFNSQAGYRAQFAISVIDGERANRHILALMERKLIAFVSSGQEVPEDLVRASISALEAKLWIYEREVEDQMGREDVDIQFARWNTLSEDGVGLLAPLGTLLELKGGWIDATGQERSNPAKKLRAEEIYKTGYS
jgi:hypothetical protein